MLEQLKERINDRDVILGVIMVVSGGSLMWSFNELPGLFLIVYGLVQMFWKEDIVQTIEEHHHHHHHNNNKPKKKAPRKKNG